MTKAAIIHGTGGSPSGNWFPWLSAEIESRGIRVIVPQMPTPDGQSLDSWIDVFNREVGEIGGATLLIGHSIGAVFIARYLERLSCSVAASVFVCPFIRSLGLPEFDTLNASFLNGSFDWPKIRANGGRITVLCSDDDPYVPISQPLDFAKHLDVSPIVVRGGKHLNQEGGFTQLPVVLKCLNFDERMTRVR